MRPVRRLMDTKFLNNIFWDRWDVSWIQNFVVIFLETSHLKKFCFWTSETVETSQFQKKKILWDLFECSHFYFLDRLRLLISRCIPIPFEINHIFHIFFLSCQFYHLSLYSHRWRHSVFFLLFAKPNFTLELSEIV